MNRDDGSYQLSHTYDRFLGSTLTYRAKNRKKKTYYQLLLMKASDRGRNVKSKELFGSFDEFLLVCLIQPTETFLSKIDAWFLLESNRKSYALYRMVILPMTLSAP